MAGALVAEAWPERAVPDGAGEAVPDGPGVPVAEEEPEPTGEGEGAAVLDVLGDGRGLWVLVGA
jgi:hypothetical protein